jgi:hypothetical protein
MSKEQENNPQAIEQEAKQLFVHGLLRYRSRKETQPQREARIAGILDSIREQASPSPIQLALPLGRRIILLAASILVLLFVGRFLLQSRKPQILEAEILSHTLENSRKGVHYFQGSFLVEHRGRVIRRKFEAFFGPKQAFAIRILRLWGSITFGSDGKRYWIRAKNAAAFDLPFLPKDGFPLLGMGNSLSYLEVRPLLEAVLDSNSQPLFHSEERGQIRFQGNFHFPAFFKGHPLGRLSGSKGIFDLWIDKETSMIQSALLKAVDGGANNNPPFRLRLVRKQAPPILNLSDIFAPKRVYIPPRIKMTLWGATVLRKWGVFRKKAREQTRVKRLKKKRR